MQHRKTMPLTEYTPLSVTEQRFLDNYIRFGSLAEAVRHTPELRPEEKTQNSLSQVGQRIINKPNVRAEYERILNEAKRDTLATATEVMEYFTAVMRGEVKDQFGLDAALAERTKAAQELAKRTIDIENRKAGNADQTIAIKLDWSRD